MLDSQFIIQVLPQCHRLLVEEDDVIDWVGQLTQSEHSVLFPSTFGGVGRGPFGGNVSASS